MLKRMKNALWFILEPLMTKNESYSFGFYKALIEKVKNHRDALDPENDTTNMVSCLNVGAKSQEQQFFLINTHSIIYLGRNDSNSFHF